jgi:hypothetical protein
MTSRPHNLDLDTEQITQPTTQPPVEQWSTEAHEAPKTKENRSLEGQDETNQATSDDKKKGTYLPKEKLDVGRNEEEELDPNEGIAGENEKPPGTNDVSEDDDKAAEEDVDEPHTEPGDEYIIQHDKRMYVSPSGVAASEDHDVMRIDYEPCKEPIEGVDDV